MPTILDFRSPLCKCLAELWYTRPSPSLNHALRWSKLEAATPFPLILLGGSLIPIVVYWDGDGFSLAKHIPRFRGDKFTPAKAGAGMTDRFYGY